MNLAPIDHAPTYIEIDAMGALVVGSACVGSAGARTGLCGMVVRQYFLCLDFSPLRTFCGGVQLMSYVTQSIAVEMCTIIFPWDTTGRNGPTDIFQYFKAEIMDLMKP